VLSVPDAIGIAIERWMQDKQGVQQDLLDKEAASLETLSRASLPRVEGPDGTLFELDQLDAEQHAGACPDCGSQLEFAEGCMKCHVCGFSECG
jgi:ribonucleoside-diphosphate reductase alpha chain